MHLQLQLSPGKKCILSDLSPGEMFHFENNSVIYVFCWQARGAAIVSVVGIPGTETYTAIEPVIPFDVTIAIA